MHWCRKMATKSNSGIQDLLSVNLGKKSEKQRSQKTLLKQKIFQIKYNNIDFFPVLLTNKGDKSASGFVCSKKIYSFSAAKNLFSYCNLLEF